MSHFSLLCIFTSPLSSWIFISFRNSAFRLTIFFFMLSVSSLIWNTLSTKKWSNTVRCQLVVNFVCFHTSIPWLLSLFWKGSIIILNHIDVDRLCSLYLTSKKSELYNIPQAGLSCILYLSNLIAFQWSLKLF